MRLLIIEDEIDLANPLARALRREGYAVDVVTDGHEGLRQVHEEACDLIILDVGVPGVDGLEIARRVRNKFPEILVLMLTARGEPEERVAGLDSGADDYLVKPFHYQELSARVRALLRRDMRARASVLTCGDLRLDPAAQVAWKDDQPLDLPLKELSILQYLMRHPGEVVSHEELLDHVWDSRVHPLTNVLPVHINSLRARLGESGRAQRYIVTVPGAGYKLECLKDTT